MIITIDGPAGSGKSTIADILSENLGFIHFNSGSLYRGITAYLHSNNFDVENLTKDSPAPSLNLEVNMVDDIQRVFVNGTDFTPILRNNTISTLVPFVAANKSCRTIIDNCQRKFCSSHNVVMEGRDLGSFVFPDAEIKFYLDCSIEERAKRRYLEEKAKNPTITLEEIETQIRERDHMDKNRDIAPLVVPKNATIIDSTNLTIDEVVETMLSHIKNKEKSI